MTTLGLKEKIIICILQLGMDRVHPLPIHQACAYVCIYVCACASMSNEFFPETRPGKKKKEINLLSRMISSISKPTSRRQIFSYELFSAAAASGAAGGAGAARGAMMGLDHRLNS